MKIAIITWFHYRNYGTALQVVATYNYLKSLGHSVDVINYKPYTYRPEPIQNYTLKLVFKRIKSKFSERSYSFPRDYYESKDKCEKFDAFLSENLSFTKECVTLSDLCELNTQYDAFVCGSDQIWAPTLFDSHYFLDFVVEPNKMIAYAPSIGLAGIGNNYIKEQMKKSISRFKHLSVREEKGRDIIKSLTGQTAEVVCDPTLLLDSNQWNTICDNAEQKPAPYILVYMLGKNDFHWEAIKRLSNEKGIPLKIVPVYDTDLNREGCIEEAIGPKEFVSLISKAALICTDSYHGILFSLNFNKEFIPFERFPANNSENQNSRVYNILSIMEIKNSLIEYTSKTLRFSPIDYSKVNKSICDFKNHSFEFLKTALIHASKKKTSLNNRVLNLNDLCCGCSACENTCPKSAIKVVLNKDGFYHASIDFNKCINCGKCIGVCPFCGENAGKRIEDCELYSFKASDNNVLLKSSSGGFAHLLSEHLIDKGYSVVGCTFDNDTQSAKHILIDNKNDLWKLQGSKYMQSDFRNIINLINECHNPIVVFGTPCQISSIRKSFTSRNDILYIELLCHGVPSYNLYRKYLSYLEKEYNLCKNDISTIFRYKKKSWRNIYLHSTDGINSITLYQKDDPYFQMFEKGACYSKACYECRWRDRSVADIRIADYWGNKFSFDTTGVSMIIQVSEKGKQIISQISNNDTANISQQDIIDCLSCQQTANYPIHPFYDELISRLRTPDNDIVALADKYTLFLKKKSKTKPQQIQRFIRIYMLDKKYRKREK